MKLEQRNGCKDNYKEEKIHLQYCTIFAEKENLHLWVSCMVKTCAVQGSFVLLNPIQPRSYWDSGSGFLPLRGRSKSKQTTGKKPVNC